MKCNLRAVCIFLGIFGAAWMSAADQLKRGLNTVPVKPPTQSPDDLTETTEGTPISATHEISSATSTQRDSTNSEVHVHASTFNYSSKENSEATPVVISEASTAENPEASTTENPQAKTVVNSEASTAENSETSTAEIPEASTAENPEATTVKNPEAKTVENSEATTAKNPEVSTAENPEATTAKNPEAKTVENSEATTAVTSEIINGPGRMAPEDLSPADISCSLEKLTAEKGEIKPPYENEDKCQRWLVEYEEGYSVDITVDRLDLDGETSDYVLISPDENTTGDADNPVLSWTLTGKKYYKIPYKGTAYIQFVTHKSKTKSEKPKGFRIIFERSGELTTTSPTSTAGPIPDPIDTESINIMAEFSDSVQAQLVQFRQEIATQANKFCSNINLTLNAFIRPQESKERESQTIQVPPFLEYMDSKYDDPEYLPYTDSMYDLGTETSTDDRFSYGALPPYTKRPSNVSTFQFGRPSNAGIDNTGFLEDEEEEYEIMNRASITKEIKKVDNEKEYKLSEQVEVNDNSSEKPVRKELVIIV
ncbi:Proteoglycan 4 [Gryllus bimaculatus]|nr:Proteoglycan 4 [Gryllus bimaculatus]